MSNNWVKPGAEVIFRSSGGWNNRFGRTAKIAKVYKNGNFTVEGSPQQYRPQKDYAWETGQAWRGHSVYPLTDETKREVERERRMLAAKKIVGDEAERLDKLSRTESDELIAEAEAIQARAA